MKTKTIIAVFCVMAIVIGCQTRQVTTQPYVDPCPMPAGNLLNPAIQTAEQTLNTCPDLRDRVFRALVDIGKRKPQKENGIMIRDMFIRLTGKGVLPDKSTKDLYNSYFSTSFARLPDTKTYNLPTAIDSIKKALGTELALKRVGLVECSGDREAFEKAEAEHARLINFLENLVLNEDYMKSGS